MWSFLSDLTWKHGAYGLGALVAAVLGRMAYQKIRRPMKITPDEPLEEPIEEDCSLAHFPSPNRNEKRAMPPTLVVVHDTEGGSSAKNIASYFMNSAAKVSSHLVVDESGSCYRSVADEDLAWHAGPANGRSLGIELVAPVGAYKRTRQEWLETGKLLDLTADRIARWCSRYGIPAKFVDAEGLKRGEHGITTHAEVTRGLGGTHVDPGPNFPMDELVARVARRMPYV